MSRLSRWIRAQAPSREVFEANRFLRPFAKRVYSPALWRFTRRSVPRGVALGLLVGIFLLIPGVQIAAAALLALPVRANIPLAAAMTFLSMPLTTPFILLGAGYVGGVDVGQLKRIIFPEVRWAELAGWVLSDAAPATLFGLFAISVVAAAIGYVLAVFLWRWRLVRKWRARSRARQAA
jgi:hypothetical protein